MQEEEILNSLREIAHNPFFIFMSKLDGGRDNDAITLELLARETDVTAGRIAEVLDIKPSSVTQMIKKLSEVHIVEKIKSEQDARVTYVKLTPEGQKMVKARQNIAIGLKEELFKSFSQEEITVLNQGVEKLANQLNSQQFCDKLKQEFGNEERWQIFEKMNARMGQARGRMMREFDFRTEHLYGRPHIWSGYDTRSNNMYHQRHHKEQDSFSDMS